MKYEIKTKKLPKSEVEIEVSLPADLLNSARQKAINLFSSSLEIDGFRKGHVPEKVVIEKVGDDRLLDEAADILLKEHFPKIIVQENFDIIGQPKISITKLALENPVEFKAIFAVMPVFELPDYREIASNINAKPASAEATASEKEVDEVLLQIRKNKAHMDWSHSAKATRDEHNNLVHDHPDFDKEENLPPLDDVLAQAAGSFKNLAELKEKIKENIISEKKYRNAEKKRAAIMDELVKKTKIELPEILVTSETEKSLAQMKDEIERMGGNFANYLTNAKKSEDDLKKDLRESSEKKAKIQLVFNKIAVAENLEPNKEILENEVKEIMQHYPGASETNARVYVSTILMNQEVLKLLESQNG